MSTPASSLDRQTRLSLFRMMLRIREFEDKTHELYKAGQD